MTEFIRRPLHKQDLDAIYILCNENKDYYDHLGEEPTEATILKNFSDVPPRAKESNKVNFGYFFEGELIAWLEMVKSYPEDDCTLIGLLMVKRTMQNNKIGTKIYNEIENELRASGCKELILCYAETSSGSRNFWLKNGFVETGDVDEYDDLRLVAMEKIIN